MREIKFRGYNEISKEMVYPAPQRNFVGNGEIKSSDILKQYEVVMQYTGLKDKNCKDIYEGDIITTPLLPSGVNKSVVEYNPDTCCYIKRHFDLGFVRLDVRKNEIEVIGNIYENPLLNKNIKALN